jgi:hypothetical protein
MVPFQPLGWIEFSPFHQGREKYKKIRDILSILSKTKRVSL